MRRVFSVFLSLALVGLSAGLEPYAAWAQFRVEAVPVRGGTVSGMAASGGVSDRGPAVTASLPVSVVLQSVLPMGPVPHIVHAAASAPAPIAPPAVALAPAIAPRVMGPQALAVPLVQNVPAVSPAGDAQGVLRAIAGETAKNQAEKKPLSLAAGAASSAHMFDGAVLRPAGTTPAVGAEVAGRARRSRLNAVVEKSSQPAEEIPVAAPAPLLEGRLDLASLRLPLGLRVRRAAALALHYALLAAVPVLLGVGLGFVPMALGVAAAVGRGTLASSRARANGAAPLSEAQLRQTRELLLKLRRGEALSDEEKASIDERAAPFEQLLTWSEGTVEYLVGRMGLDPQRAPRVFLDETSYDLHWAASVGGRLDKSGALYLGVGYVLRPLERAVGVIAHELGHLFYGDKGWLRERLRMRGGVGGGFKTGLIDAGSASVGAAVAYAVIHAALFAADPTLLLTGLAWVVMAMASAGAALLAGLAATRQEELRADWFSAWLTEPAWLSTYLSEESARGRAPRPRPMRWLAHMFSTHPAWETRTERLAAFGPRAAVISESVLPVTDSPWALSGEIQAVISGVDESIGAALVERANGAYDIRLYLGVGGSLIVRAHPAQAARLGSAPDAAFSALLSGVLAERFPAARIESMRAQAHPVIEALRGSALGRKLLLELGAEPISVRWEASWPADGPRAALVLSGPRPEILLNAAVFWKASPKAAASALAHELFHYKVRRRLLALGIDWMDMGGLEFERLAQGVGYRVFAELGGEAGDDLALPSGGGHYASGLHRWLRSDASSQTDALRQHGYESFMSLASLREKDAADVAAELGGIHTAESVGAQLDAAWALYQAESRREKAWVLLHPLASLFLRLAR